MRSGLRLLRISSRIVQGAVLLILAHELIIGKVRNEQKAILPGPVDPNCLSRSGTALAQSY